jgi:hypothetical protein
MMGLGESKDKGKLHRQYTQIKKKVKDCDTSKTKEAIDILANELYAMLSEKQKSGNK